MKLFYILYEKQKYACMKYTCTDNTYIRTQIFKYIEDEYTHIYIQDTYTQIYIIYMHIFTYTLVYIHKYKEDICIYTHKLYIYI